jgi:3',5'-cyclic AMP phosphodiesterase CpdA
VTGRRIIAQISDLHIKLPGELAYGRVDTAAALSHCIAALNRFQPRPDLVVISGDLVDVPCAEAYRHLLELLAPLQIACGALPGNHDDRGLLSHLCANGRPSLNVSNRILNLGDLDIVMIDSTVPGANYGALDDEALAWLDGELGGSTTRPALLFLHHPPFFTGIGHMDVQNLRNPREFGAVLRRHPRVRLVAAGHVHRSVLTTFAGIAATICPAPNHAVALDLDVRWPPSFNVEPPAFHLHVWTAGEIFGDVVTHLVPIGTFDGPHPFFDGAGRLL